MAGPLDPQDVLNGLPQFAIPGLRTPATIPTAPVAPAVAPAAPGPVGALIDNARNAGALAAYGVPSPASTLLIPGQQRVATPAAAPAPTPAATRPAANAAPAAPVAPPASPVSGAVSPTPGAGNPLPGDTVGLPTGAIPAGAAAATGTAGGGRAAAYSPVMDLPTFGGDNGVEVIRGGTPTNLAGTGIGGNSPYRDPYPALQAGYNAQEAFANRFIDRALNYISGGRDIFEQATRGRAIANVLHATVGPNNQGATYGGAADSLNNAIAGITSAGIGANAQMYGADQGLAGRTAEIAGQERISQNQLAATPRAAGQTITYDRNQLPNIVQNYVLPTFSDVGGHPTVTGSKSVTPEVRNAAPQVPVEGSTGNVGGKPVVFQNGQWRYK